MCHSIGLFCTAPAKVPYDWVASMRLQPVVHEKLFNAGDKLIIGNGVLKGLDAVFVQPDGETRAMLLINLLSKPHMVSYETANLLHTEFKNAGLLRLGS